MSQINPKNFFYNTIFSVQLLFIAGHSHKTKKYTVSFKQLEPIEKCRKIETMQKLKIFCFLFLFSFICMVDQMSKKTNEDRTN